MNDFIVPFRGIVPFREAFARLRALEGCAPPRAGRGGLGRLGSLAYRQIRTDKRACFR